MMAVEQPVYSPPSHPYPSFEEYISGGHGDNFLYPGFEDTTFDWLFTQNTDGPTIPPGEAFAGLNSPPDHEQARQGHPTSALTLSEDPSLIYPGEDRDKIPSELGIPTPQNRCNPDDPWPMQWYAAPSDQTLTLPMLGESDNNIPRGSSYCQIVPMTDAAVHSLQKTLQMAVERTPGSPILLGQFPSREKIDHCIDRYFAHYHRVWQQYTQTRFVIADL
jgi:hypothetical protein